MSKIGIGVIGVGNCFAGLVQGIEYYRHNPDKMIIGIMNKIIGGYSIFDINFTSAFDVAENKTGKALNRLRKELKGKPARKPRRKPRKKPKPKKPKARKPKRKSRTNKRR